VVLIWDERTGSLQSLPPDQSGLNVEGEIRGIQKLDGRQGTPGRILIVRYHESPLMFNVVQ
jgi:hypothetical protein